MSFSEDCARFGDQLARLIDSGVSVRDAAVAVGMSSQRCYAILREIGRPVGRPQASRGEVDQQRIVAVFTASGSINQAAKSCGVSHGVARRILVAAGLVDAQKQPWGKADAKRRFLELTGQGWSAARAAREVGANERTGRDWRDGVRRVGNTRVHRDGTVVDYATGTRYKVPVTKISRAEPPAISDRYLSLQDRLVIADGLLAGLSITRIADRIGKHKSTVSREVAERRIDGLYLPYQANQDAVTARVRPKESKLVTDQRLRAVVEEGLSRRLSPEQIANRLCLDFPDDESMRVSHETIYQALYFQARGGLKTQVQQALRSGRTRRVPRRSPEHRTHRFVDPMIMISDRPAEVEDRAVPGHWEGDLVRHEALCDRVEVKDRHRCAVAAA
jgi:transposase, IS30 family